MILIQILLVFFLTLLVWTWANSRSRLNLPPGPSPIFPFFGNLLQMLKFQGEKGSMSKTFLNLKNTFGPVCYVKLGRIGLLVIQDLEIAKEILCNDIWVDRPFDELISERSFGRQLGVIFSSGEVWKEMRRFTTRTLRDFGFGKQKSMESVLEEEVGFIHQTLSDSVAKGTEVSMRQFFSLPVLNALWGMVAGTRFAYDDAKGKQLVTLVDETSKSDVVKPNLLSSLPFFWRLAKFAPKRKSRRHFVKTLQDFFRDILLERRKLGSYKNETKDFIDAFLLEIDLQKDKHQNHYTDDQFIMVCFDLFIAGADTTSTTLEFAVLYMILNPECQRKVQQEIDSVLGGTTPNWSDKSKMPYTEATLLETQRMACVLPFTMRSNVKSTQIAGYDIPKGTYCATSIHNLHYSSSVWSDPTEFRPQRFLDASNENVVVNAHEIIPFGLGKRVCLGEVLARASLFSYFTSLLQRYSISASPRHPPPSPLPFEGFTLSPQPYHAIFTPR